MYRKTTKSSALYHIKDNIQHFQFNLSFRHINSLLNLPKFDVRTSESAAEEPASHDSDNAKVIAIKWQEKVFSAHEIEFYRDINNCTTDAQKSYHQQLILRDGDDSLCLSTEPIFTYVDEDNFVAEEEEPVTIHPLKETNSNSDVLMYVYAALNPNTMLVSLRWQPSQKILHIYPDFNSFRENPYFIEIDTDYRQLYAYGIENVSKQSRKEKDVAAFAELKLPAIPHWEDMDELSKKFAMPPKRTRRVAIIFEIQRAEGFEYDDIHVRYYVRLPERTIVENGLLTGSTHSSRMNGDGVWSLAHCWEIVLLCEEDFELESLCHVYFEIISVDNWERERVEGFSHFSFFLEQGLDVLELQCHRPIEGGILEKLSRYFIGGRRKFDFEKFYGGEGGVGGEKNFSNRYGTDMVSTGTLAVRCQRLSQRNPELLSPAPGRMSGMTLEDIMKAYREARKRLEAVVLD